MKTALPLAALAFALGCGPLSVNPGGDFAITVVPPPPSVSQQVEPLPVQFTVTGCDSFTLALQHVNTGGAISHPLPFQTQSDGTFTALLPIEWLPEAGPAGDNACASSAQEPDVSNDLELTVTCSLDGRTASSDNFEIDYAVAPTVYLTGDEPVDDLYAGPSSVQPFSLGGGWLDWLGQPGGDYATAETEPYRAGGNPLFAISGNDVELWAGCPLSSCDYLVGDDLNPGAYVFSYSLTGPEAPSQIGQQLTPNGAVDMAYDGLGNLLLLTQTTGSIEVDRLTPGGSDTPSQALATFGGVTASTRFGQDANGNLYFLGVSSSDSSQATLFSEADGTFSGQPLTLPGSGPVQLLSLSPDAQGLAVVRGAQVFAGGAPAQGTNVQWNQLTTQMAPAVQTSQGSAILQLANPNGFDIVWMTDRVGVWNHDTSTGATSIGVDVFSRTAPHALAYHYQPDTFEDNGVAPGVEGAAASSDILALTTDTGVRILGVDGTVIAGSDPFPCTLLPTANAATVGPGTFAAASGEVVYVFDTTAFPQTVAP